MGQIEERQRKPGTEQEGDVLEEDDILVEIIPTWNDSTEETLAPAVEDQAPMRWSWIMPQSAFDLLEGDGDEEIISVQPQASNTPSNRRTRELWQIPGPLSGFGPKNYRRSDEDILEEVYLRLTQHGRLDARQIEIDVSAGVIILRGRVGSRWEKQAAQDALESIAGVEDIRNYLRLADIHETRSPANPLTSQ